MTNTIWLFVDGGVEPQRADGTFLGAYAFIIAEETEDSIKGLHAGGNYDFSTTVPRMEFTAILEGLRKVKDFMKEGERYEIYLVADALNSVLTINEWHHNWIKLADSEGNWRRKDRKSGKKEPVLNQDLIKLVVEEVNNLRLNHYVKIMHVNSHIQKKGFEDCYSNFLTRNNIMIDRQGFKVIIHYNEMVDHVVQKYKKEGINQYDTITKRD